MKVISVQTVALLALGALLAGCESPYGNPDYTGSGALIGGASGAAIGAMADRNSGAGALIGGAAGLLAGGLIGHGMDQQAEADRERQREAAAAYASVPQRPPLAVVDVKSMAKAGVSDDVIIGQIVSTHSVYTLDANAIIDLKSDGVSEKVISYMINTPNTASAAVTVTQAPPAPPAETVVVSPGPGYVWVDGEWVWNGGWVWVGGHWGLPPYPHAVWVEGRWYRGPYGWHRDPGHWR